MRVQVKEACKSLLIGSRVYTSADGPFELSDSTKVEQLIKAGVVDPVATINLDVASKAVKPKLQAVTR